MSRLLDLLQAANNEAIMLVSDLKEMGKLVDDRNKEIESLEGDVRKAGWIRDANEEMRELILKLGDALKHAHQAAVDNWRTHKGDCTICKLVERAESYRE